VGEARHRHITAPSPADAGAPQRRNRGRQSIPARRVFLRVVSPRATPHRDPAGGRLGCSNVTERWAMRTEPPGSSPERSISLEHVGKRYAAIDAVPFGAGTDGAM
jgi:hypothetical protein